MKDDYGKNRDANQESATAVALSRPIALPTPA